MADPALASANTANAQTAEDAMSCCTVFYGQDWVRALAEDCFHPGGADLTRRTLACMRLRPGMNIADVGCGAGRSTRLLAEELGLCAFGVDPGLNKQPVEQSGQFEALAHPGGTHFVQAEAARLPFVDGGFDAVLAECSFSLFPDQPAALAEFRRILKPGGALGITDMSVTGRLPPELEQKLAPWTCLIGARSEAQYQSLFHREGFSVRECADESGGLLDLILRIKRNLVLLAAGSLMSRVSTPVLDVSAIRFWLEQFREQVESGRIRYLRFNLRRAS